VIAVVPIYQLYGLLREQNQADANRLLYEVSLFQLDLLVRFMNETGQYHGTEELDPLKLAAYSAGFAHDRLVAATKGRLEPLAGFDRIVHYITGLQIGGRRLLTEKERELFAEAQEPLHRLYEAYGQAVNKRGDVISSMNGKLAEADRQLVALFAH
jgi:hypothetical protein